MYVQNCGRGRPVTVDDHVQTRLGRGLARTGNRSTFKVDLEQITRSERSFVECCGSDEDASAHTHAEIAACGRDPATRIAPACRRAEGLDLCHGRIGC